MVNFNCMVRQSHATELWLVEFGQKCTPPVIKTLCTKFYMLIILLATMLEAICEAGGATKCKEAGVLEESNLLNKNT
jgi:hypothetical protein